MHGRDPDLRQIRKNLSFVQALVILSSGWGERKDWQITTRNRRLMKVEFATGPNYLSGIWMDLVPYFLVASIWVAESRMRQRSSELGCASTFHFTFGKLKISFAHCFLIVGIHIQEIMWSIEWNRVFFPQKKRSIRGVHVLPSGNQARITLKIGYLAKQILAEESWNISKDSSWKDSQRVNGGVLK